MPTMRYNPPLVVDFTAYLASKGVHIPHAKIKIYSSFFAGKSSIIPGNCYFILGDKHGWKSQSEYAEVLKGYAEPPEPEGAQAREYWFYNQLSFACQAAVDQHEAERKG